MKSHRETPFFDIYTKLGNIRFSRLKDGKEAVNESAAVRTAAAEEEGNGNETTAGFAGFQRSISPNAYEQAVRHFFLRDFQCGPAQQKLFAEVCLHSFVEIFLHGKSTSFVKIYQNSTKIMRYAP